MSTMTEPELHLADGLGGHEDRRLAPGHLGGGDDHVHAADDLVELGLLGGPLLGGQLAGVAAGAGRVDGRLELHELGAEALGLLAGLGPDVVRLDDGAEALGRADGLQPGHADPEDQHVRRLGRAGRGGQQREVAAVGVRGDEDGLVAADVGLRLLSASIVWARESVRGIASRLIAVTPCVGEGLGQPRVDERRQEADDRLARAQPARPRPSDGLATRRMTSDCSYSASVGTIVAPASAYALSGIAEPAPAPVSTRISSPAAFSLPSASGTRATRRSPGAVSLATPTFMGTTCSEGMGTADGWGRSAGTRAVAAKSTARAGKVANVPRVAVRGSPVRGGSGSPTGRGRRAGRASSGGTRRRSSRRSRASCRSSARPS